MNILMMSWDYYPGPEGGAERQCRKIAHAMSGLGHTCFVVARRHEFRTSGNEHDGPVSVVRLGLFVPFFVFLAHAVQRSVLFCCRGDARYQRVLGFWLQVPFGWLARLSFLVGLWSLLKRMPGAFDVVHVHESGWLAGVGVWLGNRLDIPVVCKVRNTPPLEIVGYDVPFRKRWEKLRLRASYIALHDSLRDELIDAGVEPEHISVIPNGVELPSCSDQRNPHEVLYVGNFSQGAAHKGFDVLIRAWGIVHEANPAARLTMVGGGDCDRWKQMAREVGCLNSISFEGGTTDPGQYYRRASIFVLPSRHEGMSNALLEAQSYGLPAVVSDIAANQAIVQNGVNGRCYDVEDENALANMLLLLLGDPELRAKMAAASVARIKQSFEIGIICAKLLALYEQMALPLQQEI